MKKIIPVLVLMILHCFESSAQVIDCDCNGRYETEIFSEISVETVTYSNPHNLEMDIYRPVDDVCVNRPLLIFAHGGTFIFGSKNNATMVELCENFAKKGYVTASINYRLAADIVDGFLPMFFYTNTEDAYAVVLNAVMDGKAAIRYFRKDIAENGNTYGIDENQIWGGGNSAGGVLFLHAAHVQSLEEFTNPLDANRASIAEGIINSFSGGIEGDSGNSGYSSELSGVISLAGALHRSEYLDATDVPSVFCHGDADSVVPYDCNGFQNNSAYDQLCGGGALYSECETLGITTELLTFANADHCPWDTNPTYQQQMIDIVTSFLYNNIDCNEINLDEINSESKLIYEIDILGRQHVSNKEGFVFKIYNDGTVDKQYRIKNQ